MELVLGILCYLGIIVLVSLEVAAITIWVYVIAMMSYHACGKIGEYIERKFKGWL